LVQVSKTANGNGANDLAVFLKLRELVTAIGNAHILGGADQTDAKKLTDCLDPDKEDEDDDGNNHGLVEWTKDKAYAGICHGAFNNTNFRHIVKVSFCCS